MRVKQLNLCAQQLRELILLSEQIDLVQGRIGKGIFLQYYFKADPRPLGDKILNIITKIKPDLGLNPQKSCNLV